MKTLVLAAVFSLAACSNQTADSATMSTETIATTTVAATQAPEPKGPEMDTFAMPATLETTASGLQYFIDQPGTGAQPRAGQTVSVHYSGWLTDGTPFDSSRSRNRPLEFPLGQGRVIRGWDEGIAAMKIGEKRTLVIPPSLGYGARGAGLIPPNATLVFKVELLGAR